MKTFTNFLRANGSAALVACVLSFSGASLHAATGSDLLAESMKSSDMNKSIVSCDALREAVNKAVTAHPKSADEIIGAAVAKTNSRKCQKELLENAILALGDYRKYDKNLIPSMVASAIKNGCGAVDTGYGKDGYAKDGGCSCAGDMTKAAIMALGTNPSEDMVDRIVSAASSVVSPGCVGQVVSSATEAAPQYASSIADAGARSSAGDPGIADVSIFNPNGIPNAPGAFFSPSAPNGPGLVSATTPVN